MLCLFEALNIMALQTARSLVLSSSVALNPEHILKDSVMVICWHPLDLFPSIFLVVIRSSNFFFLVMFAVNRASLVLILIIIFVLKLVS